MGLYRKKPVVVRAFLLAKDLDQEGYPDWFVAAIKSDRVKNVANGFSIETLEGAMIAQWGDYIIRGVLGEIYPCKFDIFEMTYEEVK